MSDSKDTGGGGIISKLNDLPLREHIAAGLRYAKKRGRRYPPNLSLPEYTDILQTSLEKILDGSRVWDSSKVDLRLMLFQTIRSTYNSEAKKAYRSIEDEQNFIADNAVINVDFSSTPDDDRKYLIENQRFLAENHPKISEFYEEASILLADPTETFASAAGKMKTSPATFTRKVKSIKLIIKKWREDPSLGALGCEEKKI